MYFSFSCTFLENVQDRHRTWESTLMPVIPAQRHVVEGRLTLHCSPQQGFSLVGIFSLQWVNSSSPWENALSDTLQALSVPRLSMCALYTECSVIAVYLSFFFFFFVRKMTDIWYLVIQNLIDRYFEGSSKFLSLSVFVSTANFASRFQAHQ